MREVRISKHRIPAADVPSAREGLQHIYEGGTTEVSAESPTRRGTPKMYSVFLNSDLQKFASLFLLRLALRMILFETLF